MSDESNYEETFEGEAAENAEKPGLDEMRQRASAAADQLTMERAFDKYDADQSGYIDCAELQVLAAELGHALSSAELKKALRMLDYDGSGVVEKPEFIRWWSSLGEATADTSGEAWELQRKLQSLAATGSEAERVDIHVAAWKGDVALVRQFLALDAAIVNARDESEMGERFTPLHYASYQGHLELVALLVSATALGRH